MTVARITSGTTNNVIPETAELEGTIRSFSEESRALAHEGLERVVHNIAAAHKCDATVDIEQGFPVTLLRRGRVPDHAKATAQKLFGDAWLDDTAHADHGGGGFLPMCCRKFPARWCFWARRPKAAISAAAALSIPTAWCWTKT